MLSINGIGLVKLYEVKDPPYGSFAYNGVFHAANGVYEGVFWQDHIIWKTKDDPYVCVLIRDIREDVIEVDFHNMKNVILPKTEVFET